MLLFKKLFCFALLFLAFKDQVVGFGSRPLWGAVSDNMISIAQIKKTCQLFFLKYLKDLFSSGFTSETIITYPQQTPWIKYQTRGRPGRPG